MHACRIPMDIKCASMQIQYSSVLGLMLCGTNVAYNIYFESVEESKLFKCTHFVIIKLMKHKWGIVIELTT